MLICKQFSLMRKITSTTTKRRVHSDCVLWCEAVFVVVFVVVVLGGIVLYFVVVVLGGIVLYFVVVLGGIVLYFVVVVLG